MKSTKLDSLFSDLKLGKQPSKGDSSKGFARPLVMGVVNVTPDSFSDGGKYLSSTAAVAHALKLLEEGADILDIGGQSTRPPGKTYGAGAPSVSPEEEEERVLPAIRGILASEPSSLISIDTIKSVVAQKAIEAGASIINDVSAGTEDSSMFAIAKALGAPIILMHGYGPNFQRASIEEYRYDDVVADVLTFLSSRIAKAREVGVQQILADVGIGFAKTYNDNMRLIREHAQLSSLGVPMVFGASRKSSIGKAMGRTAPPDERVSGSLAAAIYGVLHGAAIIRTHDVLQTRDALNVLMAIEEAG